MSHRAVLEGLPERLDHGREGGSPGQDGTQSMSNRPAGRTGGGSAAWVLRRIKASTFYWCDTAFAPRRSYDPGPGRPRGGIGQPRGRRGHPALRGDEVFPVVPRGVVVECAVKKVLTSPFNRTGRSCCGWPTRARAPYGWPEWWATRGCRSALRQERTFSGRGADAAPPSTPAWCRNCRTQRSPPQEPAERPVGTPHAAPTGGHP